MADPKITLKNIVDNMAFNVDNGSTAATFIHVYDGDPETLKTKLNAANVVVIYEDPARGYTRHIQDDPNYKTYDFPVSVQCIDKYTTGLLAATAAELMDKANDQMNALIEAAAQGSGYTLRIMSSTDISRDYAGYDVWGTRYIIRYKASG